MPFLKAVTAAIVLMLALPGPLFAQDDLAKPGGELTEQAFGETAAPVTVIEYASLTCHHCRDFHTRTWPAIRAKYVNTGKVRFILREYPLDNLALAGFMLARCSGDLKWYPLVDYFYRNDGKWAHAPDPLEGLRTVMASNGMTADKFDACLGNEGLLQKINAVKARGQAAGVDATPTFFINGEKHSGFKSIEEFSAILDAALAQAK